MRKIFLILFLMISFVLPANAVGEISINHENGIYHIVLKGEKIKRKSNL